MENLDLHIDLDGVLANYDKAYRLLGGDPAEKGATKAMRLKPHQHFYRDLELMPDAMELWNFVKQYHPSILSAASNYLAKTSRPDKLEWVEKHLHMTGPKVVVVNYPNEKVRHCKPGSILVDDSVKNCAEWEKAGGIAILHTSAADTIHKLKSIIHEHQMKATQHVHEAFREIAEMPPTPNLQEAFEKLQEPPKAVCEHCKSELK
jgi:hypothetical protein